jgi:hypothetical protein
MNEIMVNPGILCETQTMTEVRSEAADPTEASLDGLAETQTLTDARGEARDDDANRNEASAEPWQRGEQSHLLFHSGRRANGKSPELQYDRELHVCVSENGRPLVEVGNTVLETYTKTAVRAEEGDEDR